MGGREAMAAGTTMGAPPHCPLPTQDAQLSSRRGACRPNLVPPPHLSPAPGETFLCAWVVPTLPPTRPKPRAMLLGPKTPPHKTSSGGNKNPFWRPDPLLLTKTSSVTLGAHHHELVRHYLCPSKEDGDQVRDVIHNNND